jgi:hypothetical protein
MRLVDRPYARPMRCAAIPYIGQSSGERVWFDTGSEMMGPDDHVYLSGTAVTECAKMIGWVPPGEIRQARTELAGVQAELVEARRQLADLQRQFDAIDVLASRGFVERKRPGRPPKEAVT